MRKLCLALIFVKVRRNTNDLTSRKTWVVMIEIFCLMPPEMEINTHSHPDPGEILELMKQCLMDVRGLRLMQILTCMVFFVISFKDRK